MLKLDNLRPYQIRMANHILENPVCALHAEMGLGKTAATLTALKFLMEQGYTKRTLIIAPLTVCLTVWEDEMNKWEHLQSLADKTVVCCGKDIYDKQINQDRRWWLLNDLTKSIHVLNVDNFAKLIDVCEKNHLGSTWIWDTLIIDEASKFKSIGSNRTKALFKFHNLNSKLYGKVNRQIQLTGTPVPNGMVDLFAQMKGLDGGVRLGVEMKSFLDCYYLPKDKYNKNAKPQLRDGGFERIIDATDDVILSMKKEDYLDLPDKLFSNQVVEMHPEVVPHYQDMMKTLVANVKDGEIEAANMGVAFNKCLQICNGFIYDREGVAKPVKYSKTNKEMDKLNRLIEIVEDNPSENIVVGVSYKEDIRRIQKQFPDAVLMNSSNAKEVKDRWNNGEIKMLLAHPASAGHGINLQWGGSTLIWFGLQWSLELYQQFNDRLHRGEIEKPVNIIHLVTKGCLDEKMVNVLNGKAMEQEAFMEAMKDVI